MTLQLLHSEFPYSVYDENLIFFFISVYCACISVSATEIVASQLSVDIKGVLLCSKLSFT